MAAVPPIAPVAKRPKGAGDPRNQMYARWSVVINNPGDYAPEWDPKEMHFLIWQLEQGHEEETPHIQGYVRFIKRKRLSTAKKFFIDKAHMEPAIYDEEHNYNYCSKEDTRVPETQTHMFGEYDPSQGKQGARTDLADIAEKVKQGATIHSIAEEYPSQFIRYHQGIKVLQQELASQTPFCRDVSVLVLWGETNMGKTHRIRVGAEDQGIRLFVVEWGRDPFGTYQGEEMILFDEWNDTQYPIAQMNKYLDKWRLELNCRYMNRYAAWTHVVICSNFSPLTWYGMEPLVVRRALLRRITRSVEVKSQEQDIATSPDDDLTL